MTRAGKQKRQNIKNLEKANEARKKARCEVGVQETTPEKERTCLEQALDDPPPLALTRTLQEASFWRDYDQAVPLWPEDHDDQPVIQNVAHAEGENLELDLAQGDGVKVAAAEGAVDPTLGNTTSTSESDEDDSNDWLNEETDALQESIESTTGQFRNAPISRSAAKSALKRLNAIVRPPRVSGKGYQNRPRTDQMSHRRLSAMVACLNLFCDASLDWTSTCASEISAIATGYSVAHAKKIRQHIRNFINDNDLPGNKYGKWHESVLADEDLAGELKIHLQSKGKYPKAEDIVEYLSQADVQARFKLEKAPTVRTAQRWMQLEELGFRWGQDPKGQYADGHEREDVVAYRNEVFIPAWTDLERRARWYDSKTTHVTEPQLLPGELEVEVHAHDESIFLAGDRRQIHWVPCKQKPVPHNKSQGHSMMVSSYVGVNGWLQGDSPRTRSCNHVPRNTDGYMTNADICDQLRRAIKVVQKKSLNKGHVFLYDNATIHTKRRDNAPTATNMPLKPSKVFSAYTTNSAGEKVNIRMGPAKFADGSPQDLYFPDDHETNPGEFKGIAQILRERGIDPSGLRLKCPDFKCDPNATGNCCARRTLYKQPDFASQKSLLEEIAEDNNCRVLFYPKYHCELNPIEQCWGFAKRVYRQFPASKLKAHLEKNALAALESVPVESIRRFFNRSLRFIDAYRRGLTGQEAAWASKKYRGHRVLPLSIMEEIEAEFRREPLCTREDDPCNTVM